LELRADDTENTSMADDWVILFFVGAVGALPELRFAARILR